MSQSPASFAGPWREPAYGQAPTTDVLPLAGPGKSGRTWSAFWDRPRSPPLQRRQSWLALLGSEGQRCTDGEARGTISAEGFPWVPSPWEPTYLRRMPIALLSSGRWEVARLETVPCTCRAKRASSYWLFPYSPKQPTAKPFLLSSKSGRSYSITPAVRQRGQHNIFTDFNQYLAQRHVSKLFPVL